MTEEYIKLLPRKYIDLKNPIASFSKINPQETEEMFLYGKIFNIHVDFSKGKSKIKTTFSLRFSDDSIIKCTLFGPPAAYSDIFIEGYKLIVSGTLNNFNGNTYFNMKSAYTSDLLGRILPVYANNKRKKINAIEAYYSNQTNMRTKGIDLSNEINSFFVSVGEQYNEEFILRTIDSGKKSYIEIISDIHNPDNMDDALTATEDMKKISSLKVIFDGYVMSKKLPRGSEYAIPYSLEILKDLSNAMPISLTAEQKKSVLSILDKLSQPVMTTSLISGDVGTGKTAVIALIAASVIKYDHDVAIMVPNTVLPEQFYLELKRFWPDIPVVLVDEKFKKKNSEPSIYVGTTNLISKFKNHTFGLVVVDEQHRFSFSQRKGLKAFNYVEATATCIPHTMGLIQYSGFHIVKLIGTHVKKNIETKLYNQTQKVQAFQEMAEVVRNGGKVIIIYPSAEKKEGNLQFSEDRSAEMAFQMVEKLFPGMSVCVHGKMKSQEKLNAVNAMKNGDKKILVSTTVVEVGVDIKDVRLMIISDPQNLGLSQLHQLRGRLARNGGEARCLLFLKNDTSYDTVKRLGAFCEISDGFELAEYDMKMRGIGNIDGSSQNGKTGTFLLNFNAEMQYLDLYKNFLFD
jgi:ATP-dependent DNA helicase RecG